MNNATIQFQDQQTLRYRTQAQMTLARETVLVEVKVTMLIPAADHAQDMVGTRILPALNTFLPAEWAMRAPMRSAETAGFERITRHAFARVALAEDYNLTERARQASSDGLSITDVRANYALPGQVIDTATQTLRLTILKDVAEQVRQFTLQTEQTWRIADIEFGIDGAEPQFRSAKGSYRAEISDAVDTSDVQSSAERLKLLASVVLVATT